MRSQSNLIVSAVVLSFFVWITLRGTLKLYLNDLGIGKPAPAAMAAGVAGGMAGPAIPPGLFGGSGGVGLPSLPSLPIGTPPFNPNN